MFRPLEKLDERSEELESREVRIELAAFAVAVFDAVDEQFSIEEDDENGLLRFEQISLLILPKPDEPFYKLSSSFQLCSKTIPTYTILDKVYNFTNKLN